MDGKSLDIHKTIDLKFVWRSCDLRIVLGFCLLMQMFFLASARAQLITSKSRRPLSYTWYLTLVKNNFPRRVKGSLLKRRNNGFS